MAQILSEGGAKPTPWNIRGPKDPRIREEWRWAWGHIVDAYIVWEGGGSTVFSYGPAQSHGTLRPEMTWTRNSRGLAITQPSDSTGAGVDCGAGPDLANRSFSVAVAHVRDDVTNDQDIMYSQGTGSTSEGLHMGYTDATTLRFAFWFDDLDVTIPDERGFRTAVGTFNVDSDVQRAYYEGAFINSRTTNNGDYSGSGSTRIAARFDDSFNHDFTGDISVVLVLRDHVMTAGQVRQFHRDPFGPFRPRERDVVQVLTAGTTVTVGQATETDTSQSVGSAKSQSVGQPAESDSAFSVTAAKTVSVGQPTSTAAAQAVSAAKTQAVGLASESDASLAAGAAKAQSVGLTTETDSALAVTVGTATVVSVGQATETDSAQAVSSAKSKSVGQATESDLALSVTPVRVLTLGQASEVDTAQAVDVAKTVAAGLAVESDQTFSVQVAKVQAVGQATETDEALAVVVAGAPIGLMGPFTMFGESLDRTMTGESIFRTMSDEDADRTMSGEE